MQEYNICYSLDKNYVEQFSVSAVSILKNSHIDDNINFYILDGGLTDKDKSDIELLKNIKDFNVEYIVVNEEEFKDCPLLKEKKSNHSDYHVTLPTYYRFKLPDFLPNIDKVLYLDCDVIVTTSLMDLYNIPLKNKAVAMVEDVESKREAKRLGLKKYCNAGVMLINLDYWRKNNIKAQLFDYAKNHQDEILWQDQDVINVVLSDEIKIVDTKWNYQYFLYDSIDDNQFKTFSILHLAGRFKPWLVPFEHFVYDYYYYYLGYTSFSNRIIEYKKDASGKFLKDNIGGNKTNILINATNEDIQKIYDEITKNYEYTNKLASNLVVETDEKISKVYDEITKNYEYTNKLQQEENFKIDVVKKQLEEVDAINENFKKEISTLYEKVLFNDECFKRDFNELKELFLNELNKKVEWVTSQTDEKLSAINGAIRLLDDNFQEKIKELASHLVVETDEKISKVYEEITKNYKYTEKLVQENKDYTDNVQSKLEEKIKITQDGIYSYIDNKNEVISDDVKEKVTNLERNLNEKIDNLEVTQDNKNDIKINEVYTYANNEIAKVFEQVHKYNENLSGKIDLKSFELWKTVEERTLEINSINQRLENKVEFSKITNLEEEFSEKLKVVDAQHKEQISFLTSDFENQLNEQRIKYEKKLMSMENSIADLEKKYIESKKSFFVKVIEKYKKRS